MNKDCGAFVLVRRGAARHLVCILCLCVTSWSLLNGQARIPSSQFSGVASRSGEGIAGSFRLEWRHEFQLGISIVPVGTSDEEGTLWLITRAGRGKPEELSRIDPEGKVSATFSPILPLKPIEWVNYLSPATSGNRVGLLANAVSGGQQQTQEGTFFVPVGTDGLGPAKRVAGHDGPQFPHLIGNGTGQFIAVGDQAPMTLLQLDATGAQQWRRSFSRKLVLPSVAVGSGGIFVLSDGDGYVLLQVLDQDGHPLRSKRIAAKQGTVTADPDGGCTILFSKGDGGKENRVHLVHLSQMLRERDEIETPLVGWGGRTYQLISTPRGHLVIGEGAEQLQHVMAEFDQSDKLIWQQTISTQFTPLLAPFRTGFYIVKGLESFGMSVEKYVY